MPLNISKTLSSLHHHTQNTNKKPSKLSLMDDNSCDSQFPQPTRPMQSYNLTPVNENSETLQLPESPKHGCNYSGDAGPVIDCARSSSSETLQLPQSPKHGCNYPGDAGPVIDCARSSSSETLQLPQSPKHGCNYPGDAGPVIDCARSFSYKRTLSSEEMLSPFLASTPREEVEAVEELVVILIDCLDELNTKSREVLLRKFFSEIEKEVSLERFIIERLRNSRVRAITELLEKFPDNIGSCQVNSDGVIEVEQDMNDEYRSTRSIQESVEGLSLTLERFKVITPWPDSGEVEVKVEEKKS